MTEFEQLNQLTELLREEMASGLYPHGRGVYMRQFEAKFGTSLNEMDVAGGINQEAISYWKSLKST